MQAPADSGGCLKKGSRRQQRAAPRRMVPQVGQAPLLQLGGKDAGALAGLGNCCCKEGVGYHGWPQPAMRGWSGEDICFCAEFIGVMDSALLQQNLWSPILGAFLAIFPREW